MSLTLSINMVTGEVGCAFGYIHMAYVIYSNIRGRNVAARILLRQGMECGMRIQFVEKSCAEICVVKYDVINKF